MLPPAGTTPAERWVAEGRLASACDLIARLQELEEAFPITVLAAEPCDRDELAKSGATVLPPAAAPFHFGRALAQLVERGAFTRCAYFGGASAPLLTKDLLQEAFERIQHGQGPTAVVNNYHSSDWILLNQPRALIDLADRLPKDNPMGWVLDHEAGFQVHALPPCAATRCDIDTPMDLVMLKGHPALGPSLQSFLCSVPGELYRRVERMQDLLRTPAKTLALIGRASSHVWSMLERRTQIWTRVFVEERGMVASGRLEHGEVRSMVAEMVDTWGPCEFLDRLSRLCDGALWDTRVWMGSRGAWPSTADRFAADLGHVDQIQDDALQELTRAIEEASFPILAGGYGVVSGGLYALLEVIEGGRITS